MGECLVLHGRQDVSGRSGMVHTGQEQLAKEGQQHYGNSTILADAHSYCNDEQKGQGGDGTRQYLCLPDMMAWHALALGPKLRRSIGGAEAFSSEDWAAEVAARQGAAVIQQCHPTHGVPKIVS